MATSWTMRITAIAAVLCMAMPVHAQFQDMGVGARAMGMGRAFTAVANDPSALFWNASGMTQLNRTQGIILYAPMYVGLNAKIIQDNGSLSDENLALTYGAVVFPTSRVHIGLDTHVFTSSIYDEYRVSLGFAKFFGIPSGTGFAVSTKFKLLGYGLTSNQYVRSNPFFTANGTSKQGFTADLGGLVRATDRLSFGASLENIIPTNMALAPGASENVPFMVRLGTALKWPLNAFDDFRSAVDVVIRNDRINNQRQVGLHAGAEMTLFSEMLAFRTGFNVSPKFVDDGFSFDELSFGFGYQRGHIGIDYALIMARNLRETLGTHMFSVGFRR